MIWRYWHGDVPPAYAATIALLIDAWSPGRRVDLTDDELEPDVRAMLDDLARQVVDDRYQQAVHRANLLRWHLLATEGGVWLDHDVVVMEDVHSWPRPWCAAVGDELVSCAMGFDAGHPVPAMMLEGARNSWNDRRPAVEVCGDAVLNGWVHTRDLDGRHLPIKQRAAPVARVPLPFDSLGTPLTDGREYAPLVHLWGHRSVQALLAAGRP